MVTNGDPAKLNDHEKSLPKRFFPDSHKWTRDKQALGILPRINENRVNSV